jgi:hypothetical protein
MVVCFGGNCEANGKANEKQVIAIKDNGDCDGSCENRDGCIVKASEGVKERERERERDENEERDEVGGGGDGAARKEGRNSLNADDV